MLRTLIFLMLLIPGLALANSGRVLYVSGQVTVERGGKLYRAVKNARIKEGDIIETAAGGRLHLRMSDRSLISLKPNTRFQVKTYRFREKLQAAPTSGAPRVDAGDAEDRSIFGLFKGGFRAITGLIGQRNKRAFGVETPVATIGIRGTTFVADLVGVPADNVAGAQPVLLAAGSVQLAQLGLGGSNSAAGGWRLSVGVGDGAVVLRNAQGELVLENGEFGVVEGANGMPRRSVRPGQDDEAKPKGKKASEDDEDEQQAESDDEQQGGGDTESGGETTETEQAGGDDDSPQQADDDKVANRQVASNTDGGTTDFGQNAEQEADELVVPGTELSNSLRDVSLVSTFHGPSGDHTQLQQADEATSSVDADGHLTAFDAVIALTETGELNGRYQLEDGVVSNAGTDPQTGLQWGRWSGGIIRQTDSAGTEQTVSTDTAQWHLVQSALHGRSIALPSAGSRSFELIGNTDPTDLNGQTGVLAGTASLVADFDQQTINSSLALSINAQVWQANGSGNFGSGLEGGTPAHTFTGTYNSVSVDGQTGGLGQFSGFLTDQASGAGLSYQLQNAGDIVHGAAAFAATGN